MHLLAVSHTGLASGAERVLERVLSAAVQRGWQVRCCTPAGPLATRLVAAGVTVVTLPALTLGEGPLPWAGVGHLRRSLAASRILRKQVRDADLVIVNGVLGLPAIRLANPEVPVVWLVHDVVTRPSWRAVVKFARTSVDLALCVSQAAAAPVRTLGLVTAVIPQGTPWPVEPAREASSPPIIGCAGLLTPWKGQLVLLEAAASMARRDAVVEIVGATFPKDAEYAAALRERAARPDLAGRVRFLGPVEELLERMRDWSVLVSASIEPETGPLVCFEAMSVGVPIVATAHGGPLEFVGDAGVLVPPGDPERLASTLDHLLQDAPSRSAMGQAGRRQVADSLVLADRMEDLLHLLAGLAPGAAGLRLDASVAGAEPAAGADVRIGIVSYNTAALLDSCLASLPAALEGLRAEVVVVDNASVDGSADVASTHGGVEVVRSPTNAGYAKAMNRALSGSSAPALIALNPDTCPGPGSLARLVRALDEHPAAGCVVPVLRNQDGSLQHSVHRFPSVATALVMGLVPTRLRRGHIGTRWWLEGFAPHDRGATVDWAIGAVHCLRAAALAEVGGYSERWFMYAEDMELSWRLAQAGWSTVLEPAASVEHVGNAAGAVEFGVAREARWLDANYDWYVTARGAGAARAWAAAHVLGLSVKRRALAGDGDDAVRHRDRLSQLRSLHLPRTRRPRGDGLARRPPGPS